MEQMRRGTTSNSKPGIVVGWGNITTNSGGSVTLASQANVRQSFPEELWVLDKENWSFNSVETEAQPGKLLAGKTISVTRTCHRTGNLLATRRSRRL